MLDNFGRDISYLRISVTDLCNCRCTYCMPEDGVSKLTHDTILSIEEIEEITKYAVSQGVNKVRLTGGEPLVRKGIVEICRRISAIEGVNELCITTNGLLLSKYAKELAEAGVDRVNISLDTLDEDKYKKITRCKGYEHPIQTIFEGIEECDKYGIRANKINAVLMGGINDIEVPDFVELTKDRDIQVRFIELMPIGEAKDWDKSVFIPNTKVLDIEPRLEKVGESGVSVLYQVPGYKGMIGLISTISNHFCEQCNRLRLTADGKLKACLHSNKETIVKGKHGDELLQTIKDEIAKKPKNYDLRVDNPSESARNMNQIGG